MKELRSGTFKKRIKDSLRLKPCPHCGGFAEIIVEVPMYGRTGARVICKKCKTQTEFKNINDHFHCDELKAIGTPITPESMALGIKEAVKAWNGETDYE